MCRRLPHSRNGCLHVCAGVDARGPATRKKTHTERHCGEKCNVCTHSKHRNKRVRRTASLTAASPLHLSHTCGYLPQTPTPSSLRSPFSRAAQIVRPRRAVCAPAGRWLPSTACERCERSLPGTARGTPPTPPRACPTTRARAARALRATARRNPTGTLQLVECATLLLEPPTVAPTHWRFRRLQATSLSASRRGPTHQIHHLSHCRSDEPCFFVSTDHMVGARTTSPAATPASGELGQYQRGQRIVWAQRTRILRLARHRVIRHRSS